MTNKRFTETDPFYLSSLHSVTRYFGLSAVYPVLRHSVAYVVSSHEISSNNGYDRVLYDIKVIYHLKLLDFYLYRKHSVTQDVSGVCCFNIHSC